MHLSKVVALALCFLFLGCTSPSPNPTPTSTPAGENATSITLDVILPHSMENITLQGLETRGNHEISQYAFAQDPLETVSYAYHWSGGMGGGITTRQLNFTSPALAYKYGDYLYYCGWYWNAERQIFNCTAGSCGLPIFLNYTIEREKGESWAQFLVNNQTLCFANGTYRFISIVKPYPAQEIPANESRSPIETSGTGCPCLPDYADICHACAP